MDPDPLAGNAPVDDEQHVVARWRQDRRRRHSHGGLVEAGERRRYPTVQLERRRGLHLNLEEQLPLVLRERMRRERRRDHGNRAGNAVANEELQLQLRAVRDEDRPVLGRRDEDVWAEPVVGVRSEFCRDKMYGEFSLFH